MNRSLLTLVWFLNLFSECIGWNSATTPRLTKDMSIYAHMFPFQYQNVPKIYKNRPIRSIDIGCGRGQSSDFLNQLLHEIYYGSTIHMVGMDTVSMDIYKASLEYPHIEFIEYDVFRNSHIPSKSLDVIQMSLSSFQFYTLEKLTKIDALLHPQGCLHVYGSSIPSEFKWTDMGLECVARIPYLDPHMEYIILRKIRSRGFFEGIPHLVFSA